MTVLREIITNSASFEKQNSRSTCIKIYKMLCFVRDKWTKVTSHHTVPSSVVFTVEFSLDVGCDILFQAVTAKKKKKTANFSEHNKAFCLLMRGWNHNEKVVRKHLSQVFQQLFYSQLADERWLFIKVFQQTQCNWMQLVDWSGPNIRA